MKFSPNGGSTENLSGSLLGPPQALLQLSRPCESHPAQTSIGPCEREVLSLAERHRGLFFPSERAGGALLGGKPRTRRVGRKSGGGLSPPHKDISSQPSLSRPAIYPKRPGRRNPRKWSRPGHPLFSGIRWMIRPTLSREADPPFSTLPVFLA